MFALRYLYIFTGVQLLPLYIMSIIESFENVDTFKGVFKDKEGRKNKKIIMGARILFMLGMSLVSIFLTDISQILSFAGANVSTLLNFIIPVFFLKFF